MLGSSVRARVHFMAKHIELEFCHNVKKIFEQPAGAGGNADVIGATHVKYSIHFWVLRQP